MANRYLLGFDVGSSSVKASLVNADSGKCVATAFFPEKEAPITAVKAGWAEQDPQMWWDNAKLSLKKIMAEAYLVRLTCCALRRESLQGSGRRIVLESSAEFSR